MTRDRKITILCAITFPVLAFGHDFLNLYVWGGLIVLLMFALLTIIHPSE